MDTDFFGRRSLFEDCYLERSRANLPKEFMGRTYVFHCSRCGYQAQVSGGREEGFHCVTQTVACSDCKALHEVAVKLRVAAALPALKSNVRPRKELLPSPIDPTKILLFGEPPRTKWVIQKPGCPVAKNHRVTIWTAPGKCPRCGNFMERTVLPFRVWD
jgi:hypothetical protein